MDEKQREELCLRCGRCCRIKATFQGFLYVTDKDCPHLERLPDGKTRCTIYNERLWKIIEGTGNICVPIMECVRKGENPEDCPYSQLVPGYKSKIVWEK